MFTARNRQNPFAKRRQAQAEAEAANSAPESSPEPPAPKPVQMATGGIIDPPKMMLVEPTADAAREAADELSRLGQEMISLPEISAATQAKIDAVVNHTITPAEAWTAPDPADIDAQVTRTLDDIKMDPKTAELVEQASEKRGRGRPRPKETIVRDNTVHTLLLGADPESGISKESIAAELDEKEQQVYSSLRQLKKEGRADTRYVKDHGWRWFAVEQKETGR